MNPISDRGPAPAFYDPPTAPESLVCDWCNGSGKVGCSRYCDQTEVERDICRRAHGCTHCKGYGRVEMAVGDWKDKADADLDARREMKGGL